MGNANPHRLVQCAIMLALGFGTVQGAHAAMPAVLPMEDSCVPFLPQAERHYAIPAGLLAAIALTESGSGGQPHPWALNLAGQPRMADSYAAAAGLLRKQDGTPRQDLAVGCMQIHMRYHLASIETPEWVLRPRNNVWYAAGFLRRLYDQYGSWRLAVGHYNASDPAAQNIYICQVARSLARVAPETAAALSFSGSCAAGPRKDSPRGGMLAGGKQGGWGSILVGMSTYPAGAETPLPAGRIVPVSQGAGTGAGSRMVVLRGRGHAPQAGGGSTPTAGRCAAPPSAAGSGGNIVIIRAGKCGSERSGTKR